MTSDESPAGAAAPGPTTGTSPGEVSTGGPGGDPQAGAVRPGLPPGAPGIGSIFVLAFLTILVPGLAAYGLLRLAGLAIGPAGLLGLLVVIVCLGGFPVVLQRLGWVRRRARSGRNRRS